MHEHENEYSADTSELHQRPSTETLADEETSPKSFLDDLGHFEPEDDIEIINAMPAETAPEPEVDLTSIDTIADAYRRFVAQEEPEFAAKPGALEERVQKFKKFFPKFLTPISDNKRLERFTTGEVAEHTELFDFTGIAIFSDIDGTITNNEGGLNETAVQMIKDFMKAGGTFIPVTGRARFESVKDLVEALDVPFIVINNGAEIFDRNGNRIWDSKLTESDLDTTFRIVDEEGLIWMQNKKDPETSEEHLYSNFTEESEQAMKDVGIEDTVHNEEGRIGLQAMHVDASVVRAIPGQNYKIQMMSPDADAIQRAYDKLQAAGIPCMLNMQSPKDGRYHWVEVIRGTKIAGIQTLIDNFLDAKITSASVVGDGGNDKTMFKDLRDRDGNPIINTRTAVKNACEALKQEVDKAIAAGQAQKDAGDTITTAGKHLDSSWDALKVYYNDNLEYSLDGGGSAIAEMILDAGRKIILERTVAYMRSQYDLWKNAHLPSTTPAPGAEAVIHRAVERFENHHPGPNNPNPTSNPEAA